MAKYKLIGCRVICTSSASDETGTAIRRVISVRAQEAAAATAAVAVAAAAATMTIPWVKESMHRKFTNPPPSNASSTKGHLSRKLTLHH